MDFEELKRLGHVTHHNCAICGVPVGYSVHPEFAAAVFNSACGCGPMDENYRLVTHGELAALSSSSGLSRGSADASEDATPSPSQHLRVTKPDTIAQFVAALADHGVKLPLLETDEDVGTLLDADGEPVLVVDVDRGRSHEHVAWIVGMIQVAVNTCGGFKAQRRDTTESSANG